MEYHETKVSISAEVVLPNPTTVISKANKEDILLDTLTNKKNTNMDDISKTIFTAALPSENIRSQKVPLIEKPYHWRLAPSNVEL